ncbi:hypothetical protein Ocin01_18651 [Orchesella cincta]|uniref:Uncharacterized protein n=1 Tax=Orchesella cincta TaxID=48709 RepID=A0A1D2M4X2_ORCCI|nr:hypothetical protein Ocin01_18651 [Orchesella cincta]
MELSLLLAVLFVNPIIGGFWDPNLHIYCENYFFNVNNHRWECPAPTRATTTPKPPPKKSSETTTSLLFAIFLIGLFVVFVVAISKCLKCLLTTQERTANPSAPPLLTLDSLPLPFSNTEILKKPVSTPPPEYQEPPPYNDCFCNNKGELNKIKMED